jgi:hypothetical protein
MDDWRLKDPSASSFIFVTSDWSETSRVMSVVAVSVQVQRRWRGEEVISVNKEVPLVEMVENYLLSKQRVWRDSG